MRQLYKAIVGSKLHGLDTPTSDEDVKGIHIGDLREKLSLFSRIPSNIRLEDKDDTSYELDHFVNLTMKGNPTILECLFSDLVVQSSPEYRELRDNWEKVFNTEKYISACIGYASTQHRKADLKGPKRQGKLATAEVRVLCQGITFLKTGQIECRAPAEYIDLLMDWKTRGDLGVSQEELKKYSIPLVEEIKSLEENTKFNYVPDQEWVDDYIYRSYTHRQV